MNKIAEPIVLALDMLDLSEADQIISKVRPYIGMIKIGAPLYYAYGMDSLKLATNYNLPIFLDIKICDIPSVTKNILSILCDQLSKLGQESFVGINCSGGSEMCKVAVDCTTGSNVKIVGNAIFSTLSGFDLYAVYNSAQPTGRNSSLIKLAYGEGIRHFVTAPQHLDIIKRDFKNVVVFSAGIRGTSSIADDQKRVKTVSFAIKKGSDWVIIGRPITLAGDPTSAIIYIKQQIDKVR